eukprot:CAMPEP_0117517928 /NCGR_PEP_ID=MMETSP0784-20121206/31866_1 /TAXON_ID=39447 /ORGANISM="" /LENGTH=68 /DNA_ID=CAMNT_0005313827 /DNA_START=159 /DNA_END=362 /DNA_ORIENTATION=-
MQEPGAACNDSATRAGFRIILPGQSLLTRVEVASIGICGSGDSGASPAEFDGVAWCPRRPSESLRAAV